MIENEDGSVDFRYSVKKLAIRTIYGLVIIVIGVLSTEAFVTYLFERRVEIIFESIQAGAYFVPGDPAWAVILQLFLIAFTVMGLFIVIFAIDNMVARKRIFLSVTKNGFSYYKRKLHLIRLPYTLETQLGWRDISNVSSRKRRFLPERLVFDKAYMSSADPSHVFEISIACSEMGSDEIIGVIRKMRGR